MTIISHGVPYVFFYGPLLGGDVRDFDTRLRRVLRPYSAGYLQARLYDLGNHAGAVVSNNGSDKVYGTAFRLRRPDILDRLDRYALYRPDTHHHSDYLRRLAQVMLLPSRRPFTCWVYFYNGSVGLCPRIRHGDYVAHLSARRTR